ncbi:MAG: hypothetical protein JO309_01600 [Pseudonocardiales bacterium]|nr:hypothetical protein [Hyphomicrobiales bacterium]MBV8825516.1 hypothetical protein [Hyphomicrobiales bacterium]MBV9429442.1 hypothetical protein [Bradyrhizobiaceae bacterium]MBV9728110.1 hypothetical protein [Pseudonocardiales bacterium]
MLTVEAVQYRSIAKFPDCARQGGRQAAAAVGEMLGVEIARATPTIAPEQISFNMCVSTIMDLLFATGWLKWPDIVEAASRFTDKPPENFTASYECAGWGFALEYAKRRFLPGSHIVITVADLNVLDFSFWRGNPNWGNSGFGIATVVFKVPEDGRFPLIARVAQSSYGMAEFCVDLRKWLETSESGLANVPFLPSGMAEIYTHFLKSECLMPNLHGQYGHCFGSDTWVSYITHAKSGRLDAGRIYTATSASLRGYWSITDLTFSDDCRFEFTA